MELGRFSFEESFGKIPFPYANFATYEALFYKLSRDEVG
jgi:hypothetical protein